MVLCTKCGTRFDRDKVPFDISGPRRYCHKECPTSDEKVIKSIQELTDLENYIKKLFNEEYVNARTRQQINNFHDQYKFTYTGMLKTLIYWYEIKGQSTDKAYNGIGIIPFIYQDAAKYYKAIWEAQQKNKDKNLNGYKIKVREITIKAPQSKPKKRKLFTFLDDIDEEE